MEATQFTRKLHFRTAAPDQGSPKPGTVLLAEAPLFQGRRSHRGQRCLRPGQMGLKPGLLWKQGGPGGASPASRLSWRAAQPVGRKRLTGHVEGEEDPCQHGPKEHPHHNQHKVIHCQGHAEAQRDRQHQGEGEDDPTAKPGEEESREDGRRRKRRGEETPLMPLRQLPSQVAGEQNSGLFWPLFETATQTTAQRLLKANTGAAQLPLILVQGAQKNATFHKVRFTATLQSSHRSPPDAIEHSLRKPFFLPRTAFTRRAALRLLKATSKTCRGACLHSGLWQPPPLTHSGHQRSRLPTAG